MGKYYNAKIFPANLRLFLAPSDGVIGPYADVPGLETSAKHWMSSGYCEHPTIITHKPITKHGNTAKQLRIPSRLSESWISKILGGRSWISRYLLHLAVSFRSLCGFQFSRFEKKEAASGALLLPRVQIWTTIRLLSLDCLAKHSETLMLPSKCRLPQVLHLLPV